MLKEQQDLLNKAEESLIVAKNILEDGYPGFAAARAYYAIFYATEAILLGKGLTYSKHSALISAFAQHFVKTGDFPQRFHKHLIDGFKARMAGDYGRLRAVTAEQAQTQIENATEFLSGIRDKLNTETKQGDLK